MQKNDLQEKVGRKILSIIASGVNPFKLPYKEQKKGEYVSPEHYPVNYLTGKVYSGINQFILPAGYYLTFAQAKELGGKVKKDSKSYEIYFHSSVDRKVNMDNEKVAEKIKSVLEENPNATSFYWGWIYYFKKDDVWYKTDYVDKKFNVFNIKDIDDLKDLKRDDNSISPCYPKGDEIMNSYCSKNDFVIKSGNEPLANTLTKEIFIPDRNRFKNDANYYQVAFNTLSSSTADILKRKPGRYGSETYSKEMLVNEIAGILSVASIGLADSECNANSGAYMKEWASLIQGSDLASKIWQATTEAISSYKYIFDLK